jgi:hypothetical protein
MTLLYFKTISLASLTVYSGIADFNAGFLFFLLFLGYSVGEVTGMASSL